MNTRTTEAPWMSTARTGWAAKRAARADLNGCADCGSTLADCEGCQEPRCLTCEPYLSDDCRWSL